MLIPLHNLVNRFNIYIKGVLHVGAHECEEQTAYIQQKVNNEHIYWVEAMQEKVDMMKQSNPSLNIYQAVIDKEDGNDIVFNIADNGQSSSMLEFGSHQQHHPHVKMVSKRELKTTRLDTLIKQHNISIEKVNFMNLDIQGAELNALISMGDCLKHIDYIYTEVNTEYVYKNCALLSELDAFLESNGFKRVTTAIYQQYGWGDAFYIRDN